PAERLTEADYDYIVDINLKGPFLLSQAVGKAMLERGQGNQINIVSLNNDRPLKGVLPYAVSKSGLGQMTRSLALEWGPGGVRVRLRPHRPDKKTVVAAEDAGVGPGQHAAEAHGPTGRHGRRRGIPGLGGVCLDDRPGALRRRRLRLRPGLAD